MIVLASYKLRLHEVHVRAVPARDEAGCVFAGPGVDLRGNDAQAIILFASPFRTWLEAREPGVTLRSVSVDLEARRILITLEPMTFDQRPRVVRIDPPFSEELLTSSKPLERALAIACAAKLRLRISGA